MTNYQFDEYYYLLNNPDVLTAVKDGLYHSGYDHYLRYGKREGRLCVPTRVQKALCSIDTSGVGLEIGPSFNPIAPKKSGFNVKIMDHLSAYNLRKKYENYGVDIDNIEHVDYIWLGGPFRDLINEQNKFDWIIASHVIEHVPDFVSFLRECSLILNPGGKISLVIPDKRFCFDCVNFISSTGQVLDAFFANRKQPSQGSIFDHVSNFCTRSGKISWDEFDNGELIVPNSLESIKDSLSGSNLNDYLDVHCWHFTFDSFLLILNDLNSLDYISLNPISLFDTVGCEFHVTLELGKFPRYSNVERLKLLRKILELT